MPNIRYVCISDLHLGQDASFLTNLGNPGGPAIEPEPSACSPVLSGLASCLKHISGLNADGSRPVLILLGDVVELALSFMELSTVFFGQFMSLVMGPGKEFFQSVVFVPGNHDHHLWELSRSTALVKEYSGLGIEDVFRFPRLPGRTTAAFGHLPHEDVRPDYFMARVLQNIVDCPEDKIATYYPTFGLYNRAKRSCVLFTHGHYFQSSSYMVSNVMQMLFPDLPSPASVMEIESENFAWVDFVYSMLGRSGNAGKRVEELYFKLRDPDQVRRMAENYVDSVFSRYDLPDWPKKPIVDVIAGLAGVEIAKVEALNSKDILNALTVQTMSRYMSGPMRSMLVDSLKAVPPDVTLVFGHTHKPFENKMFFEGYGNPVRVYNTGGWVVQSTTPEKVFGASLVLVDDDANVAAIRMYNERHHTLDFRVGVCQADPEAENPLYDWLLEAVDPREDPWAMFSSKLFGAMATREQLVRQKILGLE